MLMRTEQHASPASEETPSPEEHRWLDNPLFAEEPGETVRERVGHTLYCPFPSRVHPYVEVVNVRAVAWARGMGLVKTDAQASKLLAQKPGWLVSRACPEAQVDALQVAANWLTLFCLMDDRVEKLSSPARAATFIDGVLDVFQRDYGQSEPSEPFTRAMLDVKRRIVHLGSVRTAARFATQVRALFDVMLVEAANRTTQTVPRLNAYFRMRQLTVGLYPFFVLWELIEGVTLPDEVREHPALRTLMARASNVVGWANDLFTYPKEMLESEVHNLVLVLTQERNLSVDEAAVMVGRLHDAQVRAFLVEERELPSFGPLLDPEVKRFTAMLRCWIRGHLDWAHETGRYAAPAEGQQAPQNAATAERISA